jgi:hypothetical protein
MISPVKKQIWRNTSLKVISLLLGYTFWYIFGNSHSTTVWITVPLCFYNIPIATTIKGPDTISVKLCGKRSELCALESDQLAVHIDAQQFVQGKNRISLSEQSIFLPASIKLVHYNPSHPTIEVVPADITPAQDI